MPNGDDNKYNSKWCKERHDEISRDIDRIWGEHGFQAVWHKMNDLDKKFLLIILGIFANLGGVVAVLLKMVVG